MLGSEFMIDKIKRSNKWQEVVDSIFELYNSNIQSDRIPALINLTDDTEGNEEELYLKLVLVPKGIKVDKTWIKENLQKSSLVEEYENEKDISYLCHNIITLYNYKFNKKYAFNSHLLTDEELVYLEQDDGDVAVQLYNLYNSINKPRLLQREKNDGIISVYTPALKYLVSFEGDEGQYDLYADFEYRLNIEKYVGKTGSFTDEYGIYDITYNTNVLNQKMFWIIGSRKIQLPVISENNPIKNIAVVNLNDNKIRELNPRNYNDDTEAGLVVFGKNVLKILKKYYYIFDLRLIPKKEGYPQSMIDILDDCVVFWEGEFNGLPKELKEEMIEYNIKDKTEGIISGAMFSWQLESKWDYSDKLRPHQKLAYYCYRHLPQLCIENEVDFTTPDDVESLCKFVKNIINLFSINIANMNIVDDKKKMINDIVEGKNIALSDKELIDFFEGFSYVLLKEIYEDK